MISDPRTSFHNYTIDWNENSLKWYVDDVLIRTLFANNSEGYPQTPMAIFVSLWAGGDPSNSVGTIEWAGGETDYDDVPFQMYVSKMIIADYSTGEEYSYSDQSGSWSSIESKGGTINGNEEEAIEEFIELVDGETSVTVAVTSSAVPTSTSTSNSSSSSSSSYSISSSYSSILTSSKPHTSSSFSTAIPDDSSAGSSRFSKSWSSCILLTGIITLFLQ
ncbi:hypothetical protein PACTADRAFT_50975 [Pachysolen tannophilus NRRL Y-2460]|uniref:GH16 domain-containing protein n=1 Tax=Pachysolen tannophilus NRRL Y-2460 TaxID=669874 RepID=A0A1E4TQP0_PACTA|nr:hypothetical protein PACTADRAFT_50975 [Pachysolen tannophilus NRRL Y-2460]